MTAVTASRPWWVDRKNKAVPAAPIAPAGGSLRSRVTVATQITVTIAATCATTMGHRSVLDPASFRPMKNSPNPAPAASPSPTPAACRPVLCLPGAASRPLEPLVLARGDDPPEPPDGRPGAAASVVGCLAGV